MYRGFKVVTSASNRQLYDKRHQEAGLAMFKGYRSTVARQLRSYIRSDNYLDGTGIQKAWFPDLGYDIFISHAHADEILAMTFAGWIYSNFGITSFIDSAVWGYADELLRDIDNRYCRNITNSNYNYKERNKSTGHVHMMLASAISSMMDKCECLFFLNTPNSIKLNEADTLTQSPWLYYELGQSKIMRQRVPDRPLYESQRTFSDGGLIEKSLGVTYKVDLSHLSEIDAYELTDWVNDWQHHSARQNPLDLLYRLVPPQKTKMNLYE